MSSETADSVPSDMKERLKASYDAMASTYNEWTIPHSKLRMSYLEKALDHLNLPDKLDKSRKSIAFLELGCGCGLPVTARLLSHPCNPEIIANDLSETQIALARENLLATAASADRARLELLQGDMNTLAFPSASFDLVVGFYSVIHLPRNEQTVLLERVAKWLKPGGLFVANFATEESVGNVAEKWLGEEEGWMFWSAWGKEKTLEEMRRVGFEIVVADVVEDVVDSTTFVWAIAKR